MNLTEGGHLSHGSRVNVSGKTYDFHHYGVDPDSGRIDYDNVLAIEKLKEVYTYLGIEPEIIPMRGGTDGSYLSTRNILTPNYFTGALNFHSNKEYLPMDSFYKSFLVTLELMIKKDRC